MAARQFACSTWNLDAAATPKSREVKRDFSLLKVRRKDLSRSARGVNGIDGFTWNVFGVGN